jgi:peptidoglycan hydrolase-like protein with peptidoglycan-binding domain
VPSAVPPLSRLVPAAAVLLALIAAPAFATESSTSTGGTQAAPVAKKVSVKRIQRAVGVRADGIMGPQTRRAIRRFQRANGLAVTGRADDATLIALGFVEQSDDRTLAAAPQGDPTTILAQIAECESGGDPTAISADHRYRGKYQFSRATWEALGGEGDPAKADEATQDAMALKLYQERGLAPWPACAKKIEEG